jgi:hypothetical protein
MTFASAYNSSNIVAYYNFDSTNLSTLIDVANGNNLVGNNISNSISVAGLVSGNALKWGGGVETYGSKFFYNGSVNFNSQFFSINYWINFTPTNTERHWMITDNASLFSTSALQKSALAFTCITGTTGCRLANTSYFNPSGSQMRLNGTSGLVNGQRYMITILYNHNLNYASYFINGVLVRTDSAFPLFSTPFTQFAIGGASSDTFDEMSIWNTALTSQDIQQLYNNGLGLSFNDTLNGATSYSPVCLSPNTYCSSPFFNGLQFVCYQQNTQFCAQGCSNSSGSAVCTNTCQNYCQIIGTSNCASSTSQFICQDSTGNGCLDLNTIQNCPIGQFCINQAFTSFCVNSSSSGVHSIYGLAVTPYAVNDETVAYNVDALNRIVSVKTSNALHTQLFYTQGTTYFTRTCRYNETTLFTQPYANVTNDTTFTMTSANGNTQLLRVNFLPSAFGSGIISVRSQAGSLLSNFAYVRNITAKSLCVNYLNGSSLYCNYDYALTDTLANVQFEYLFDMSSKFYTIRMTFNNSAPNVQATYPIAFTGTDVNSIEFNVTSGNTDMFGFSSLTIPQPQGYSTTTTANNSEFNQACQYTTSGNFVVRTYGNQNGAPDYTTFADYTVNMLGLGVNQQAVNQQNQFNQFGQGISDNMKLVIVLVGIMIVIGFGLVIGYQTDTVKMSLIMSVVLSMFGLVIATLYAWVPVWVFVSLAIFGLATIIFSSSVKSSNTG